MCMEDVRINRRSYTKTTTVALISSGWVLLAKQDPDRTAIRIRYGSNVTVHITPWTDSTLPSVSTLGGITSGTETANLLEDGDAVRQPWYASMAAGAGTAFVTETILGLQ
jgi:hypothetical protein